VCASRKRYEHHICKKQLSEFRPILATDVFGFVDLLISFWDDMSNVKATAGGGITVDGSPSSFI